MKQIILLFAISIGTLTYSQDLGFNVSSGIGVTYSTSNFRGFGIGANQEANYFVNENLSFGGRFEANILFKGKVIGAPEGVFKNSMRGSLSLKSDYYIGNGEIRPFIGFLAGYYIQYNHTNSVDDGFNGVSYGIDQTNTFGFGPEIGVLFDNGVRLYGIYHIIPNKGLLTNFYFNPDWPETIEINRNYITIQVNFPWPTTM